MKDKFLETILLNANTTNMEVVEQQIEKIAKVVEQLKYFEVDKELIQKYESVQQSLLTTLSSLVDIEDYLHINYQGDK